MTKINTFTIVAGKSHLDHGLTSAQIEWIKAQFSGRDGFFIETVELPVELGTVPCGLHSDVPESEVRYVQRGDRTRSDGSPLLSRVCDRPTRETRKVSIIAGPHKADDGTEYGCLLYTSFGGPVAPREPGDGAIADQAEAEKSRAFWATHALSA